MFSRRAALIRKLDLKLPGHEMSKDLDAIIQFIEQPNTDYAYMLTGKWGSGKTYFWKHIVIPRLSQDAGISDDLVAYVTLYGMEKPQEIGSAVFGQLHPWLAG